MERFEVMKHLSALTIVISCVFASLSFAAGKDQPVFGPKKYEVVARYGRENIYSEAFNAADGVHMIQIQNGEKWSEHPDFIEFSVNGEELLQNARYDHAFILCLVKLQKVNSFELKLKDYKPTGFRRPPATPRFVFISVLPAPAGMNALRGAFGGVSRRLAMDYLASILKIKSAESRTLAQSAGSMQNERSVRVDSIKKLAGIKDKTAPDFMTRLFSDVIDEAEVRAEAGIGLAMLGDAGHIPLLMKALMDPEEPLRIGAARALSHYSENDTREPLQRLLTTIDPIRTAALIRAIVNAGWKPVGVIITLSDSEDAQTASTAISLLGEIGGRTAVDHLVKLFNAPGRRDIGGIISALGNTKDPKALGQLIAASKDPARRAGREADLGDALAEFGDRSAAEVIEEMALTSTDHLTRLRLSDAYRKLTGRHMHEAVK